MTRDVQKARSSEQIFADMHRQLRAWNPDIPESPDRLDPILRVLLQLYSHQLAKIDKRIDDTWQVATNSLIRSLSPESKRWPVPAYTVMSCQPADPVVEVDPHTRFFYKEKREGGQTFFFSSLKKEKLLSAAVRHVFLKFRDSVIDLSPAPEGETPARPATPSLAAFNGIGQVFIAVEYNGTPKNFAKASVFLKGAPEAMKQLRWGYWYPGSHNGSFNEDAGFCPGLAGDIEDLFTTDGQRVDWGGMRTSSDLFKPLEDNFVVIPESFAAKWESGPLSAELSGILAQKGITVGAPANGFYWLRIDLTAGGDRTKLLTSLALHFNCFIVVNKNELTLFKHTGGSRLVELEIPENIDSVLEITRVVDAGGREYTALHLLQTEPSQRYYSLEERSNKLVLWFDFSSPVELPPDSLSVTYTVTAGVSANGIEAGRVADLYDNHPGIKAASNVIPAAGAIPAKTEQQIVAEALTRLRSRDRALSFQEISTWTQTFDPRIKKVTCVNGVERGPHGVRRCIIVNVTISQQQFYSTDETSLLQQRLNSFLKSRSPVNTHFKIQIVGE
jgi:hypothetical protein